MSRIKQLQARVGTKVDGMWGPKSRAALQSHLRALMPRPHPWPTPDRASLERFFGAPGNESNIVSIPAPVPLRLYDSQTPVRSIRCHRRVAESLSRALVDAYSHAPDVVSRYFGCYNFRNSRGGDSLSQHAWGIAIDLDASNNTLRGSWPTQSTMPIEVMEAFAREGWMSAGAFWRNGRDAMHFAAVRM